MEVTLSTPYTTCYAIFSTTAKGYLDGKRCDGALIYVNAPHNALTFSTPTEVLEALSNLLLLYPGLKAEAFQIHQCYIYTEVRDVTSSFVHAQLEPKDLSAFVAKLG